MAVEDSRQEDICHIHWLILLMLALSVLASVLYHRKEEKDRRGRIIHYALLLMLNGAGVVLVFFGKCGLDLPAEALTAAATLALELILTGRKEKEEKQ